MSSEKVNQIAKRINEIILKENLEKVIEMTYSYVEIKDNVYYNITLFEDFGGIKYNNKKKIDFVELRKIVNNKLSVTSEQVNKLIEELKEEAFNDRGEILYKSLAYIKRILKVVILGLDFELEKAGYVIKLSQEDLEKKMKQIEKIEEDNFGLKIKNNISEIKLIHDYLFSLFISKRSILIPDEQIFFLQYINKLNSFLGREDLEVKKIKKTKVKFNFRSKKMPRDDYIKIFNFILENIYSLEQRAIITDASSIYDGEKYLEIPNKETHDNLTYKRVLELIVHEIESHYINLYNNKIMLGEFRGARNLEKEEGLAKVMEAFLAGDNVEDMIFIPVYMAKILYSEIYSGDDYYKFIDIYNKMHTLRRKPTNEFLRQKRNYSLSFVGGQHKDISYGRGMIKVRDYLRKGGDFSLLFLSKVGFEDLDKIDDLYEENRHDIIFPIFIGDIIHLFLEKKEKGLEFELDIDYLVDYLESKYDFRGIERFNLRKNISEKIVKIKEVLEFINEIC